MRLPCVCRARLQEVLGEGGDGGGGGEYSAQEREALATANAERNIVRSLCASSNHGRLQLSLA